MPQKISQFSGQPFSIKAKENGDSEIVLYGAIGESWFEDSITASKFNEEFKKIPATAKNISIRINSPGGDVFDGMTIMNRIKQHKAKKTVYIDGLAASIASIIATAGDEIVMGEGALYMIHLPWTVAMGDRTDLENTISRLMEVEEQMVSIYARKTKLPRTQIKKMLEEETWMSASEAMEMGFIDRSMEETVAIAASLVDNAKWIVRKPKNLVTEDVVAKGKVIHLKSKVEEFLARNKSAAK